MLDKMIIGGVLLACLGGLHYADKHYAVKIAVIENTAKLNKQYKGLEELANKKALDTQDALQTSADKERDKKDATINSITIERDAAISELRKRPKRPASTDSTKDISSGVPCTARELYQEDAEFLTREASRAESILVERDYYYNQYQEVRNTINGLTK